MDEPTREAAIGPAGTPLPPYTAVIFTSVRRESTDGAYGESDDGYAATAAAMETLAAAQPGYLGFEGARTPGGTGIGVSYWVDERAAHEWKQVGEHLLAQREGSSRWYRTYRVRICSVVREYGSDG